MRPLPFLIVACVACGHPGGSEPRPDADTSGDPDGETSVDAVTIDAPAPGTCLPACDSSSTCVQGTCKPGHPLPAPGMCTYIDQPGWLSCPTGMSCQCYFHYYKIFQDKPANLDTWLSDTELDVLGGTIPSNQTLGSVPAATIPLVSDGAGGKMGAAAGYTVKVTPAGVATIKIDAFSGYVGQAFVLHGDSDCGNEGKILQCTFTP